MGKSGRAHGESGMWFGMAIIILTVAGVIIVIITIACVIRVIITM